MGSRWYATDKIQTAIGATFGGLETFIHEHMTWVHPRAMLNEETDHQRIQELIKAVGNSKRTRIAGLFEVGDNTLEEISRTQKQQVRACVITIIPPGAVSTQHPQTRTLSIDMDTRRNTKTLQLILIEKGELNPIDIRTMQTEIQALMKGCAVNIPWHQKSTNFTTSCPRIPYSTHPTLAFMHPIQAMLPPEKNKSTLETHSRIAAALGILPVDLASQLRYHQHTLEDGLQTWQRNELTRILRDTAIKVYKGYINWIKKDKYGVS